MSFLDGVKHIMCEDVSIEKPLDQRKKEKYINDLYNLAILAIQYADRYKDSDIIKCSICYKYAIVKLYQCYGATKGLTSGCDIDQDSITTLMTFIKNDDVICKLSPYIYDAEVMQLSWGTTDINILNALIECLQVSIQLLSEDSVLGNASFIVSKNFTYEDAYNLYLPYITKHVPEYTISFIAECRDFDFMELLINTAYNCNIHSLSSSNLVFTTFVGTGASRLTNK